MAINEIILNKKNICLKCGRLTLRPLETTDITEEYVSGLNLHEVNQFMETRHSQQTFDSVKSYVESNRNSNSAIFFGIFLNNSENPFIGTIRLSEISVHHFSATIGICIFAARAWKSGYAKEALDLVTYFSFKTLGLHYLEAGAYEENTNSLRLFERCGFSVSFVIKNKYCFENHFVNAIFMTRINDDFTEILSPR